MSSFQFIQFFSTNVGLSAEGLREPGPFHAHQGSPDLRPKLKHMEEQQNYYKTLGVGWDAPPDVIRKNYKQLALFYHPDKQDGANEEASAQFSKISEAYAILSDPLRRLVYDLVLGIRDKTDKEVANCSVWDIQETCAPTVCFPSPHAFVFCWLLTFEQIIRMSKMKMEQALEDIANMSCTVPLKREAEEQKKGLVIVNATYGLLQDATGPLTTLNDDIDDPSSIDVTIPIQCMVEDSSLIIPAGESKAWLTGFYDPCIGEPKQLRVRCVEFFSRYFYMHDGWGVVCFAVSVHAPITSFPRN